MAAGSNLLDTLRAQLARFDEDAFVALSSKGLVRRAQRDLESLQPHVTAEVDKVSVALGPRTVILDARGPQSATCDCPARGACQHIIAALLFLKTESSAAATGDAQDPAAAGSGPEDLHLSLMAIPLEAMITWAGRAVVRAALEYVERESAVTVEGPEPLRIRFAHPAIAIAYAGGGLDGLLVDRTIRERKRYAVAAVMAYQRANGLDLEPMTAAVQPVSRRSAPTEQRAEDARPFLQTVENMFDEAMEVGLTRLSDSYVERATALAASADGLRLHRLALLLRRAADQVEIMLDRQGSADSQRLFSDLALASALVAALRATAPDFPTHLRGRARAHYERYPRLELTAIGAYPWRTGSGYTGLTLLLWDAANAQWLSWSDARPDFRGGFNPVARYRAAGPWQGASSPADICGRKLTLLHAQISDTRALSSTAESHALVGDVAQPDLSAVHFDDWQRYAAWLSGRQSRLGLGVSNPLDHIAVLTPARFGERRFDPVTQTFIWQVFDNAGAPLLLKIAFSELAQPAIERLENVTPAAIAGFIVRPSAATGSVEPLMLVGNSASRRFDSIYLDSAGGGSPSTLGFLKRRDKKRGTTVAAPRRRLSADFEQRLLEAAEAGTQGRTAIPHALEAQLQRLDSAGLSFAGEVFRFAPTAARALLRAQFALGVHEQIAGGAEADEST